MKLSKESLILITVGTVDLSTTLWWVLTHGALEANPIFRHYLEMGPAIFALMKILLMLAPIFLLEWARRRRPKFTLWASRFAIGAYVSLYIVGFARLNSDVLQPKHENQIYAQIVQLSNTDQPINPDAARHVRYLIRAQRLGLIE